MGLFARTGMYEEDADDGIPFGTVSPLRSASFTSEGMERWGPAASTASVPQSGGMSHRFEGVSDWHAANSNRQYNREGDCRAPYGTAAW